MKKVRILLADDHTVMRAGLRALLERQPNLEVVGEAGDGRQTVELASSHVPDVVVMDIAMPTLNGVEATRRMVSKQPAIFAVSRCVRAGPRRFLSWFHHLQLPAPLVEAPRSYPELSR